MTVVGNRTVAADRLFVDTAEAHEIGRHLGDHPDGDQLGFIVEFYSQILDVDVITVVAHVSFEEFLADGFTHFLVIMDARRGKGDGVHRAGQFLLHGCRAVVIDGDADRQQQRHHGQTEQHGHVARAATEKSQDGLSEPVHHTCFPGLAGVACERPALRQYFVLTQICRSFVE